MTSPWDSLGQRGSLSLTSAFFTCSYLGDSYHISTEKVKGELILLNSPRAVCFVLRGHQVFTIMGVLEILRKRKRIRIQNVQAQSGWFC